MGHDTITFPQGPLPANYNTENRSHVLLGVGVTFIVLEIIAFALRVTARRINHVPFGWDDSLMIPALILNLAVAVMALVSIPMAGVGRHTLPVLMESFDKIVFLGKDSLLIVPVLYSFAVALSKLAIINLFLRIFTVGPARIVTWAIGVIIVLQTIACVFATIFQCTPIHLLWSATDRGNCLHTKALFQYASIPNVATDLAMLILPMPTIWKLKTTAQIKIGVTITLLTASIGILSSILRMVGFFKADIFSDPCWLGADLMAYSVAEPGTYFLAACFPTYRPLVAFVKNESFLSTFSSRYRLSSKKYGNISEEQQAQSGRSAETEETIRGAKAVRGFDSIALSNIENEGTSMERIV